MSREKARRSGLFRRIFLTFVLTVLTSAVVAGVGGYFFAARFSSDWLEQTESALEDAGPGLVAQLDDPLALEAAVAELAEDMDHDIAVYRRPGGLAAGVGPKRPPDLRHQRKRLREGKAVMIRRGPLQPPLIVWSLGGGRGRPTAIVMAQPRGTRRFVVPLLTLGLLVGVLGAGAWVLSRSITGRIGVLEASADRIAGGDLGHRVPTPSGPPRDEIDELGLAFNEMASKVQLLIAGQKTLLANVSHELRTPIARVKVLLEILEERAAALREGRGQASDHTARLATGMTEMADDVVEIEGLISDLLTSGRLELAEGGDALQRRRIGADELLTPLAAKVDARVEVHETGEIEVDDMLMTRLVSNLLANARRACPRGDIVVEALDRGDAIEISVEDEGPGVAPGDREVIFEPFRRLDAARDRDRGGVGLGLYLCRQIARAHGGEIEVTDRLDGGSGARFVVTLPVTA